MATTNNPETFPALTSIFTPAPDCTVFELKDCNEVVCSAYDRLSGSKFCGNSGGNEVCDEIIAEPRLSCYPIFANSTMGDRVVDIPLLTYSPGISCPHGMTTADDSSLGIACCYSDFDYQTNRNGLYQCVRTLTEGTFSWNSSAIAFGPSRTDAFTSIVYRDWNISWTGPPSLRATVSAIFLMGERLPASTVITTQPTATSKATPNTPTQTTASSGPFTYPAKVLSLSVGLAVFLLITCLGFLYFIRYRQKRLHRTKDVNATCEGGVSFRLGDKPELEGSQVIQRQYAKAELDALAVRAELEGSPGEEQDSVGIDLLKPELHGTPGVWGLGGVFLKRKAELEDSSGSDAGKQNNSWSFTPAQKLLFANRDTEHVELDSRSLQQNSKLGLI